MAEVIYCDCGSGESIDTCECKKACSGPSYVGNDIREVFRHAGTRCRKPSTHNTIMGPMCDACYQRMKKAESDPHTLLGIMKEVRDEKRKRTN